MSYDMIIESCTRQEKTGKMFGKASHLIFYRISFNKFNNILALMQDPLFIVNKIMKETDIFFFLFSV